MKIRRYEVLGNRQEILERLKAALGKEAVRLDIKFADIYEGPPPLPPDIDIPNVNMKVTGVRDCADGGGRAMGFTPENRFVTVIVPVDETTQCILQLLDTEPRDTSEEYT